MTAPASAATLPTGSIVATPKAAWVKSISYWQCTNAGFWTDRDVDAVLAEGGTVVRVGTGGQS